MAFRNFVEATKKTNKLMESKKGSGSTESIIDTTNPNCKIPKQEPVKQNQFKKEDFSSSKKKNPVQNNSAPSLQNTNSNNTNRSNNFNSGQSNVSNPQDKFVPKFVEKYTKPIPSNSKRQSVDSRHCNLIVDVIKKSGSNFSGDTTWQNCKYLKESSGQYYCTEFHAFCGKDKCSRATK